MSRAAVFVSLTKLWPCTDVLLNSWSVIRAPVKCWHQMSEICAFLFKKIFTAFAVSALPGTDLLGSLTSDSLLLAFGAYIASLAETTWT